jgi:iron complex outermembrane receptor protein
MTFLRGTYILAFIFLTCEACYGQLSDTLILSEVVIPSSRLPVYSPGGKVLSIDSSAIESYRHTNIAEMLAGNSSVVIRDYGPGNSSLISIRGLEPRQTQVAWNGFNLNSASLGMTDASLIPAAVIDEAAIAYGTHTTTFGNSALGGVVMLGNESPVFDQSTTASIFSHYGSFSTLNTGLDLKIAGKKFESRTKIYYSASDNDFDFKNTAVRDEPVTTQSNSDHSYYGLMQTLAFKPGRNDVLETGIWYQVYDRNIPPLMTVPESTASQKDSTIRAYIRYKHTFKNAILTVAGAVLKDDQNYTDPEHSILADYDITNTFLQADHIWKLNQSIIWSTGISIQSSSADFKEYNNSRYRNTTGLHSALRMVINQRLTGSLSLRKEMTNIEDPPLIMKGEMKYSDLNEIISIHLSGGNHFNLPTLNDLYWVPGGNQQLKPERGITAELGTNIRPRGGLPELSVTGFMMDVEDWIKWFPGNNGLYKAENISKVRSTGIELILNGDIRTGQLIHDYDFWYTYCSTKTIETGEPFAGDTKGKQLVYVPEHTAGFRWTVTYKLLSLLYSHRFTGTQYTNPDNTYELDPFQVGDLKVAMRFKIKQQRCSVHFDINNLWNEQYQVLAWHAMPGRWYQAGFKTTINK